jgi:hypothetical protein
VAKLEPPGETSQRRCQIQVVLWLDADGVLRINTTAAQGSVQQIGLPSVDESRIG